MEYEYISFSNDQLYSLKKPDRSALLSEETRQITFRALVGRFSELEDKLYISIDSMRRAKLRVPPSLAIAKAKGIASTLSISDSDFKASW